MPFFASVLPRLFVLITSLAIAVAPAVSAPSHAGSASAKQKARKAQQSRKAVKKNPATQQEGEFANFGQWREVGLFIDDMVARNGFDRAELNKVFSKARYIDSAIKLMKPAPPGRPKNWTAYRLRFVEPVRINGGLQFWSKYEGELARAEIQYGVPAEVIVAIIGVETIYGRNTGNFRVMDAITTLAFDYPDTPTREARMQFFRKELENTLLFARESHIDPFSLLGSYAGAIGLPQFMPGSILRYAVDFDGNGKIDLRNSPVDAIGSVANFLKMHGWQRDLPQVYPVKVPDDDIGASTASAQLPSSSQSQSPAPAPAPADVTATAAVAPWRRMLDQGLEASYSLEDVKAAGIMLAPDPSAAPLSNDVKYGLIDLQNGNGPDEYWIGSNNFFAIAKYNRSYFYAMSVIDLSRAIRAARQLQLQQ